MKVFLPPKKIKLHEIFFNAHCKRAEVPQSTISKSMSPFPVAPWIFYPSDQDQENGRGTYFLLPPKSFSINLKNTSSHISMDLLGFYLSPEHQVLGEIFKFVVFRLLENGFVSLKLDSTYFYSCCPSKTYQVLIITSQPEWNCSERAEEGTKIKLVNLLATSFDKSDHLCVLHIFVYCLAEP